MGQSYSSGALRVESMNSRRRSMCRCGTLKGKAPARSLECGFHPMDTGTRKSNDLHRIGFEHLPRNPLLRRSRIRQAANYLILRKP